MKQRGERTEEMDNMIGYTNGDLERMKLPFGIKPASFYKSQTLQQKKYKLMNKYDDLCPEVISEDDDENLKFCDFEIREMSPSPRPREMQMSTTSNQYYTFRNPSTHNEYYDQLM